MNESTPHRLRVGTLWDVRSAAVAATHAQVEHTHEVRRCLKRWPVSWKDEIERYGRPSKHASAKQANIYIDALREDLETEGELWPSTTLVRMPCYVLARAKPLLDILNNNFSWLTRLIVHNIVQIYR